MSFILGLLVGLGLSSKNSRPNVGGVQFMTMEEVEEHLKNPPPNPFDLQDAFQQKMHPTFGESAASDSESKPAPKRVI